MNIILGNLFGIVDGIFYCCSSQGKDEKRISFYQGIGGMFALLCQFFLEGYQGVITCIFALCRTWGKYFGFLNKKNVYFLIFFQLLLGFYLNQEGILGLFPVVSSVTYTLMVANSNSKKTFCRAMIINSALWFIYNISILAVTSALFNIIAIVLSIVNIKKAKLNLA